MREVADCRVHGTTEERPIDRFEREREHLLSIEGRPSFVRIRELVRVVHPDLCVEVDTNCYSVPWEHIGKGVIVRIAAGMLSIHWNGLEIARHPEASGRKERIINPGITSGSRSPGRRRFRRANSPVPSRTTPKRSEAERWMTSTRSRPC